MTDPPGPTPRPEVADPLERAVLDAVEQAVIATDLEGRITYWNRHAQRTYGWNADEALGRHILDVTPSDSSARRAGEILAALRRGERWSGMMRLRRRDGSEFPARVTDSPVLDAEGRLVGIVGLSEDVTELQRAEERAREAAAAHDAINRVGRTIAAELDLEKLVQVVTDVATELTGARFGAFFYNVADERGETFMLHAVSGVPREAFAGMPAPGNTPVFGPTFQAQGVVRSADITADARYGLNAPHRGIPAGHLRVRSYLAVPVVSRSGEILGGLFFGHPEAGVFTERAERVAVGLAAQAAVGVDNARLYRQLQASHAELERRVAERTRELELRNAALERATDAARESEARFHSLFDRSPDGVVAIDPHDASVPWRIVEANDAYCAMNGYAREELVGGPIDVLHFENGSPEERERLLDRIRRKGPFTLAAVHRRKDGSAMPVEVSVALVQLGGREVLLGVDRDVSERERHERELAAANAELLARNAEQEAFVYTVSHDLRAPLLSLQGMAGLLREGIEAGAVDEARFALGRIEANVDKMGRLLDDLLRLSRAGREVDAAEAVDLGAVVQVVLSELEPRLRERGVTLESPRAWPGVLCAPSDAYQVVANLVGNALKFAGRPGEPPRVRLTWAAREGAVVLAVEDNGPGVPREHRERVFGLFQRLDARAEGTGVGLAIVKRLAERHGGRAWVEDSALGGASFSVTLPDASR